ncbi:MAG: hypothetical protein AB8B73_08340 [Ekhidna sp.]
MTVNFKPGDLSTTEEWDELVSTVHSRSEEVQEIYIDLEHTSSMNLAQFNSLVSMYVNFRRLNKNLSFQNFQSQVKSLVDKTNFHHVFTS